MRELKFRAWGNHIKEYLGTSILDIASILGDLLKQGNWTIEQYTGLKDKNGKEIYEGDIVVNTYYDDGEMYKVLWVDDSVAFGMESLDDMELYKLPLESLEVIGNIHENAELLG